MKTAYRSILIVSLIGAFGLLAGCNPLSSNPTSDAAFLQPAPGAFSIVSIAPGNAQVALTWQVSSDATSYTLLRGTSSGNYSVTVSSNMTGTSYIDTGVQNGITYFYLVVAVGPGGSTNALVEARATPTYPQMLLIADTGNNRIVTTTDMSGSGWTALSGASGDSFVSPQGVFIGSDSTIYVADTGNDRAISMQDIYGDGWLPFGSPGSGIDQFEAPAAVVADGSGNIYVADTGNSRIVQSADLYGTNWTELDTSSNTPLIAPTSIAFPLAGGLLIADKGAASLFSMSDMLGDNWTAWSGSPYPSFVKPEGVFVDDDGSVYVADANANLIDHLSSQGLLLGSIGGNATGDTFDHPTGVCVDANGVIYVADSGNNRIVSMIDMAGDDWTELNVDPSGSDFLSSPHSIYCRYGMP